MEFTEAQVLKAVYESGLHQNAPKVLYRQWKDGIDIDVPTYSLMNFVRKLKEMDIMKPHFGQSDAVMNKLAGCNSTSVKRASSMSYENGYEDGFEKAVDKWPVQKEFCCDDAEAMKATIKRLENERDNAIRDHIRCCETNNHNARMYAECRELLEKHGIHMVHKECWCFPTVEKPCYAPPDPIKVDANEIKEPKLWIEIKSCGDCWLHIDAPSGNKASINLGQRSGMESPGIVAKVLREVAVEGAE